MTTKAEDASHVFISYVREDAALALRLFEDLSQAGIRVWLDSQRIEAGDQWGEVIRTAVKTSTAFVVCYSESAVSKENSYIEVEMEIARSCLTRPDHPLNWLIPVTLDSTPIPPVTLPRVGDISSVEHVELGRDWDAGIDKLLRRFAALEISIDHSRKPASQIFDFEDPSMGEAGEMMKSLPVSVLWTTAMTTRSLSRKSTARIVSALKEDAPAPEMIQALSTMSLSVFFDQVAAQRSLPREFLSLLSQVGTDEEIAINRRLMALETLMVANRLRPVSNRIRIPSIFGRNESRAMRELVAFVLSNARERLSRRGREHRILAAMMHASETDAREEGIRRILDSLATTAEELPTEAQETLQRTINLVSYDEILEHIRVFYDAVYDVEDTREGIGPEFIEAHNLIGAAMFATQSGEEQVNEVTAMIGGSYTDEIEKEHGEHVLYKTLVELLVGGRIHPQISLMALVTLLVRFKAPSLANDDRIGEGVLQPRFGDTRGSVMYILCGLVANAVDEQDDLYALTLIALVDAFDSDEVERFSELTKEHFPRSRPLALIRDHASGDIERARLFRELGIADED